MNTCQRKIEFDWLQCLITSCTISQLSRPSGQNRILIINGGNEYGTKASPVPLMSLMNLPLLISHLQIKSELLGKLVDTDLIEHWVSSCMKIQLETNENGKI